MGLSARQIAKLREAAEREGVDAADLIQKAAEASGDGDVPTERPVADKLLIGFLPFIKVRELRTLWLGLTESVPDQDLTIADWKVKHGEVSLRADDDEGGDE